jgi:hypothetical protein
MTTVNKYELYCIDEQQFVSSWGTTPPTKCPNDTSHQVNPDSVNIVGGVSENVVSIDSVNTPPGADATSGTYKYDCIVMTCNPNAITTYDLVEPIPMCINAVEFSILEQNCGDVVSTTVSPDTLIRNPITGMPITTTQQISANTKTFTVPSYILTYLTRGYYLKLMDDSDSNNIIINELEQIVSTNATNSTVTTKSATSHTFPIGSKILIERRIIDQFHLNRPESHMFGSTIIGSSYVPANTVTQIAYKNNTSETKKFVVYYEYYY